jgi:hypothetical protein
MGSWDVERIDQCFTPYDAGVFKGIPLCTRTTSDLWSWHYEKIGVSCARSAYKMLIATKQRIEDWLDGNMSSSNSNDEAWNWTKMWKVQVLSKPRVFLWCLAKQSLPTADLHRNMAVHPRCSLCGAVDSWRHSLLE